MFDFDKVLGPCMQTFGEPVSYAAPGRPPQVITGIFDAAYLELLPLGGSNGQEPLMMGAFGNVTDRRPVLGVQLSQFSEPPEAGAQIQLTSRVGRPLYEINEVRDDSHGGAKLLLTAIEPG